ncbi:MAG: uroporphyrinogen decarboxylase family protein [Acidimicrobiales bacterium]
MTLSSRERVLRTVHHGTADCLPVGPFMYDLAAVASGVALRDYYLDASAMTWAQLRLQELVGQDVICVGADNFYIAEAFGCETSRTDDELPSLVAPPLSSIEEVYGLEVPDPMTQGRMPLMLEAIELLRHAVGDEVALRAPGTGPFALASYFVGTQQWLLDVALAEAGLDEGKEAAVHHALGLAAAALIAFGNACFDAGADLIQCGDSLASCNVISPRTYERYAWPYQKRVFSEWREHGISTGLLHICGDSSKVLELYRDTGAGLIEIDSAVDLAEAARRLEGSATIVGNVDTVSELLQADPGQTEAAARRCIEQTCGRNFILGSGCLVPRYTPIENVRTLARVAHEHRY